MKRFFALLLCGAFLLLLTGCGGKPQREETLAAAPEQETAEPPAEEPAPENEPSQEPEPEAEPEAAAELEPEAESPVEPETEPEPESEQVTVTMYQGDENCEYLVSEEVQIPALTPQALADLLYSRGVLSGRVAVNEFAKDEQGVLSLDLSGEFSNMLNGSGTAGEYILLGSLVNTFLDAYEAEKILITVDGECLESGHAVYDQPLTFFED
ncbi:MAG: GerMN domain-containing protein [Candidatus Onthomonas sp.]